MKKSNAVSSKNTSRFATSFAVFLISLVIASFVLFFREEYSHVFGGNKNTYIIFYPIVMLCALAGGLISGLTVLAVFSLGTVWFLLPPVNSFTIADKYDLFGFVVFTIGGICISIICDILHKTKERYAAQSKMFKKTNEEFKESKDQLQTILENVADGIIVRNKRGAPIYANKTAYELFGLSQTQSKRFLELKQLDEYFRIRDAHKKIVHAKDLPVNRVLHGSKAAENILHFQNRKTKKEHWFMTRTKGIFDSENNLVYIVTVFADITDSRKIEQQKDDFIGIASHELKTPVTSLKVYTQVLQHRLQKDGNEKAVAHLKKMDDQINRLTWLISELLDITRMEGGRLQFHPTHFEINTLINEIVDVLQPTTKKHKIVTNLTGPTTVYADKERIAQVLTNLLTNAIKYSPDAKQIIVRSQLSATNITISVTDFGKGIPYEVQKKIFDRFYRETGKKEITIPGLGLGLYISSEIIKRQNGKIWVDSTPGKGATFFFSLPLSKKSSG